MTVRATYRLQFHTGFGFDDARRLVPYLAKLGISHIYASPILAARQGSPHGYDVIDHARINPELGGNPALHALVAALRENGMGIVLDIVPNHMAVGGSDNPHWLDVLEKGRDSAFANVFDIDWDSASPPLHDRIVVPLLGGSPEELAAAGEIKLVWDARLGKFAFAYAEHRFPVRREDYDRLLGGAADPAQADLSPYAAPDALLALLSRQNFHLAHWRDAGDRINWRRFFDINGLAALRVEDDTVFERTHATIFGLYAEGLIDGVRIDHIDGLADPRAYCLRLRARLDALRRQRPPGLPQEPALVVVEKILAEGEDLPSDWGIDGTTGYEFMNAVSGVQTDASSERALTRLWTELSRRPGDFESEERDARREILNSAFTNALDQTAAAFHRLDARIRPAALRAALELLLERFRAYRTYAVGDSADPPPGAIFEAAVVSARADAGAGEREALDFVAETMRGAHAALGMDAREAARRFNQLAAPVAAKAVEDTAFYRYGRLLSRNDVGFSPGHFAMTAREFHAQAKKRQSDFPRSLLATATHDHKRGEDARARLAALSEVPGEWEAAVREWSTLNTPLRTAAIAPGDEYQLYQTLVAAWPLELSAHDLGGIAAFTDRLLAWRLKSLREAKLVTSWAEPSIAVELAHADFVRALLDPGHGYVERLAAFADWLAPAAALNGLVACVLRCTSPGVPDLYQGAELWDLSLVDPDNRRPVDFQMRQSLLRDTHSLAEHLTRWRGGSVKLALIARLLALRAQHPSLFQNGDYVALDTGNDRTLAFARRTGAATLLVAVPLLSARTAMARKEPLPEPEREWDRVIAGSPELASRAWHDVLEPGRPARPWNGTPLFEDFPAAILMSD